MSSDTRSHPFGLEVEHHESDEIGWEFARKTVPLALSAIVRDYSGYSEWAPGPVRRREVPHGAVTVILNLGEPLAVGRAVGVPRPATGAHPAQPTTAEPAAVHHHSFLAGLHDVAVMTEHPGSQHGIQIDLHPLGANRLFGVPMDLMANEVVDVDGVGGRRVTALVERLGNTVGWADRFDLLDRTLTGWALGAAAPDPAIAWAWAQLERSAGLVNVGMLAEEIGWSHRHFTARFRQHVGLAPKATARVLRFHHAVELLGAGAPTIGAVAATAGFADHSHLVREFRSLAACTPSELLGTRLAEGAGFAG